LEGASPLTQDLAQSIDDYAEEYLRQQSKIRRGLDFFHGLVKRPPPLFVGLIPERTLLMISAEPGCGKTALSLAAALALDTMTPLLGTFAPRERRRTFFLGNDAPDWDYAEVFRKLGRGIGLSTAQQDDCQVDFLTNEGGSLTDKRFLAVIQKWHEEVAYNVVIFDTLASFHDLDENDTRQMGAIMAILKRLRDSFNCTVIFTHHSRKPSGDEPMSANYSARGNSVISGSIDFHLHLRRSANKIRMSLAKGRGSEKLPADAAFEILEGECQDGPYLRLSTSK